MVYKATYNWGAPSCSRFSDKTNVPKALLSGYLTQKWLRFLHVSTVSTVATRLNRCTKWQDVPHQIHPSPPPNSGFISPKSLLDKLKLSPQGAEVGECRGHQGTRRAESLRREGTAAAGRKQSGAAGGCLLETKGAGLADRWEIKGN